MATGEVRIAISATANGTFHKSGASTLYVQLSKLGKLGWTAKPENATIYPNETWARKDMTRWGVPDFARCESVGGGA